MRKNSTKVPPEKFVARLNRYKFTDSQYREILKVLQEPIFHIPNERFQNKGWVGKIMEQDIKVSPGLSLSSTDSETLFWQYNYARNMAYEIKERLLNSSHWHKKDLLELLYWHEKQLHIRSKIITGNMGLVMAMAKQVHYGGVEFTDLISEGNIALMRAVERFDCARGFKFSTYACRAILKGFYRIAKNNFRYRHLFSTQLDSSLEKDNHVELERELTYQDQVAEIQDIFRQNKAALSGTEQLVVALRFNLNDEDHPPMTLKEVGAKLGLSKERIRQIQKKALNKLRQVAEEQLQPS